MRCLAINQEGTVGRIRPILAAASIARSIEGDDSRKVGMQSWQVPTLQGMVLLTLCDERFCRALDSVAPAAGIRGFHGVVVGRLRWEIVQVHAEDRRWMVRVEPDYIFGCLVQIVRICAVVHDRVVDG